MIAVTRLAKWLIIALLVLAGIVAAALAALDTGAGHRFIIEQVEKQAPESGLRVRIGRIDGSIYGKMVVRDLELFDPGGRFLYAPVANTDWRPFRFLLLNRLDIESLTAERTLLDRLPRLTPSAEPKPLLPEFDIRIGRFSIGALEFAEGIAGPRRFASVTGNADIRAGRAEVKFDAAVKDGADRLVLDMAVVPEAKQLRLAADVVAPRGGVLAAMLGLDRPLVAAVRGSGDWEKWRGALVARSAGDSLARLTIAADDGRYRLAGPVNPGVLVPGLVARLTPGGANLALDGRFVDQRFDGDVTLNSRVIRLTSDGGYDFGAARFDNMRLDARVLDPSALLAGMAGQNVTGAVLLDGDAARPRFEYLLRADSLAFGKTMLAGLQARGQGVGFADRIVIPLALTSTRVTGTGAMGDSILANLAANGTLTLKDGIVTSDLIRLTSNKIDGRIAVLANLDNGTYNFGFDGTLTGLEIAGLGRVDVISKLSALPAAGGGAVISGQATALLRRFDNSFLRTLAGGLPRLDTRLSLGPDGIVRLAGLRIAAPALSISADGYRRADGTFYFNGAGRHRDYGPLTVTLDGPIDRPRTTLVLASPLPAAGLANVRLDLIPNAAGFAYDAAGQSTLGPFVSNGAILLPKGGQTVIDVANLTVAGTRARGRLVPVTGGLAGQLAIAGGGVDGNVRLGVVGGVQEIVTALAARDVRFPGPPAIVLRRGELNATIRLQPGGATVDATASATGFRRGSLSIARLAGTAKLVGGRGFVRASMAGTRGRDIELQLLAKIAPGAIDLDATGSISGRPVKLSRTARLRAEGGGWRVRDARLTYGGGSALVSGLVGGASTEIDARIDRLPVNLADLFVPDNAFGGRMSGTVRFREAPSGLPTGSAQLRLINLSRAGLSGSIRPIDVGLNAELTSSSLAVRAVFAREGATLGRLQGRVSPMAAGGALMDRIQRAPVTAQLRYNGEAQPLWALTGVSALDISGPIALGADISGSIANPAIRGLVKTDNGRVESAQTGTVLTGVKALGRFSGPQLDLVQISGTTKGGGTVTGQGRIDLTAGRGYPYDIRLTATNALVIDRDDFGARVTGPLRIAANTAGGIISGNVTLNESRFQLGTATAANALPVIQVREINLPADRAEPAAASAPFRLNIKAAARNRLMVRGMGLDSEWSADLTVGGTVAAMRIDGDANLLRGDYTFAGRRFELESGRIRFLNRSPINPELDIKAVSDISGLDATINVRGSGQRPEITFSSVPAMPEDELLSRILFGSSITDISVAEAAQLGAAVASLRGGDGLDPINSLRRAIGLDRLRILPADAATGQGTSIAAGKYLTRRIYVEVVTDGQGYSATNAEFQVTRWLSILSSISTLGRQSINARVSKDY